MTTPLRHDRERTVCGRETDRSNSYDRELVDALEERYGSALCARARAVNSTQKKECDQLIKQIRAQIAYAKGTIK